MLLSLLGIPNAVADAADCADQFLFKPIVNFLSEVIDVNIHNVGHSVEGEIPDMLNNHGARDASASVP